MHTSSGFVGSNAMEEGVVMVCKYSCSEIDGKG